MSTNPVIQVENLGKRYRIGAAQKRAKNLREALRRLPLAPFRYLRTRVHGPEEADILWALKEVSFEVKQGEVLGIIGRNGAGKSTLLKILSRITDPTEGRAQIRGRVNSLLEVGTGFHPELTGRENIYMNAALHGMKRAEIDRKLDEIIAFAEVEKFMDTPVKRYSSGMYTRLAFAVAAHLEPEILIVDEVLAVGDAAFQNKCLGKMGEVARVGRTVIIVSHNMGSIEALCRRCVVLKEGSVDFVGDAQEAISKYLSDSQIRSNVSMALRHDRLGSGSLIIVDVSIGVSGNESCDYWRTGEDCIVSFRYSVRPGVCIASVDIGMVVEDCNGHKLLYANTIVSRMQVSISHRGGTIDCLIKELPLSSGEYFLTYDVYHQGELLDKVEHAKSIRIESRDGVDTWASWGGYGTVCAKYSWSTRNADSSD